MYNSSDVISRYEPSLPSRSDAGDIPPSFLRESHEGSPVGASSAVHAPPVVV